MATGGDTRQTQATMPEPDDLLTTAELAAALKVNERTIRRWRNEGAGPPVLWAGGHARYRWSDVLEWLARGRAAECEPPR
jgi:excisionase family DNA binding protein